MAKSNDKKAGSKIVTMTIPKKRQGEKVAGVYSPIRFVTKPKKAKDEKEEGSYLEEVEIPVKIDPSGGYERANTTKEIFRRLLTFADAGEEFIELRRDLDVKLYKPMGLQGPDKTVSRVRYLSMTLGTTAKQQLSKAVEISFEYVARAKDATMKDEERDEIKKMRKGSSNG